MEYTARAPTGGGALSWAGGLADRIAPWVTGVLVFGLSVISVPEWVDPVVLLAASAGMATTWMARWRRWPLFVVAAASLLLVSLWPATFAASYYASTSLRRRVDVAAYAVVATVTITVSTVTDVAIAGPERSPGLANLAASLMLAVALPLVLGLWVNARRQVLAGLRDRAERLEREQAARSDQVRAQERARIAREMHDVVAHRVSLMVLRAGALEVNAPDERTAAEAALIRTTGREALGNLRDVLGVLRSPHTPTDATLHPQPVLGDLDRLLDQSRAAGTPVSRYDHGAARPLPVMVERTAYRVVQEALTNVHKHADGAATKVVLQYLPGCVEVAVHNDPAEPSADPQRTGQALPGSGLGLAGLRERVELLGGEFETRRRPDGGFMVHARIPTGRTEESP